MPNLGDNLPILDGDIPDFSHMEKYLPLSPYSLPLLIWELIQKAWSYKDVAFLQSYPRENVKRPTIVWSIHRRVPGKEGVETLKPRYRGSTVTESDPGIITEQYAQWMTIIYQFDIYDIDDESTNSLTEAFDELMFFVVPLLQKFGVSEWLFEEQLKDTELERRASQEIYARTLRFRCILERKFIKPNPIIQSIQLQQGTMYSRLVNGEQVVRGGLTASDTLQQPWVTSVWMATSDSQITFLSYASSGTQYMEGVDFRITVDVPTGASSILWLPQGLHPMPGQTYYVTYFYRIIDETLPVSPA
jgi:hypothetical protein